MRESSEAAMLLDETMPAELGLLLPALDETEAALVTSDAIVGEEDHEHDDQHEVDPDDLTLSSLAGEEEEADVVAPADDEDTLSLSDIAEEESAAEDSDSDDH